MVALYTGAAAFHLKHYDVKLDNVLLQKPRALKRALVLRYVIKSMTFALRMPSSEALVAKLADFGSADVDPFSTGRAVQSLHFVTIQHTPPEYMYLGDHAQQGQANDIFCIGLAMLHLFAGKGYDAILGSVSCPPSLGKLLWKIWKQPEFSAVYSWAEHYRNEGGADSNLVCDTFYRYMVLIGFDCLPYGITEGKQCLWDVFFTRLSSDVGFHAHQSEFLVLKGTNRYLARARRKLEVRSIPRLLESLKV
jgi:serine/threonine protein kinase